MSQTTRNNSSRSDSLLELVAEAFADGRDPFSLAFLQENDITGQECYQLGQDLANIVKGWLGCSAMERLSVLACAEGKFNPQAVWHVYRRQAVTKALTEITQESTDL